MLIGQTELLDPQGLAIPKPNVSGVEGEGWLSKGSPDVCQESHFLPAPPQFHGLPNLFFPHLPLVPTWILALSLSLAGAALLLAGLVIIALIIRKGNRWQRKRGSPELANPLKSTPTHIHF